MSNLLAPLLVLVQLLQPALFSEASPRFPTGSAGPVPEAVISSGSPRSNPWDKYMLAPDASRTQTAKFWTHVPAGSTPPQPASGGDCEDKGDVAGIEGEWKEVGKVGTQMTLSCPAGGKFTSVVFASFGHPSGSCGNFHKGDCDAPNTTRWVEELCLGKSSCTLPPDPTVRNTLSPLDQALGDPCYGSEKHFAVQLHGCSVAPKPEPVPPALPFRLQGKGDAIIFDFGQEVGGFTKLSFGSASDMVQVASLAYSESSYYWIGGDHSNGGSGPDGTISTGPIVVNNTYTPSAAHLRGGFRYLTVTLETDGWVDIVSPATVEFLATPNMEDPSAWANHFYSSDDLLNRIWYGCGYTTQMCSINPQHGRQWPPPTSGWNNSAECGLSNQSSVLVDGAKRDRTIWPGDMGVSSLTAIVTTGDLTASRNALDTLFHYQQSNGMLPYAGPPVSFLGNSDTYHLWALVGVYNVVTYDKSAAGLQWLKSVWGSYLRGVSASTSKVSPSSGLFVVTARADWARGGQGGENCPANMLYYRVLTATAELARKLGNQTIVDEYTNMAETLRTAIQSKLWDESTGAFYDNTNNHNMHPQDGNSLALWFNVTSGTNQSKRVSDFLASNWGAFGSQTPEWNGNIGTFPGSMEVHGHMAAGQVDRAHSLMKLQWGYMLSLPQGTQSTFWEGYHSDGSFAYQGIYMSNAHGWATGPAAALTFNTLGIRSTHHSSNGVWEVVPKFGELKFCEGRLSFAEGAFVDVSWSISTDSKSGASSVKVLVDAGTMQSIGTGTVNIDLSSISNLRGSVTIVALNGEHVWQRGMGQLCSVHAKAALAPCASKDIFTELQLTGLAQNSTHGRVKLSGVQPHQKPLEIEILLSSKNTAL